MSPWSGPSSEHIFDIRTSFFDSHRVLLDMLQPFLGLELKVAHKLRAPCDSRASVDPSDDLSCSGPVGLFGDKPENWAFVEITLSAGMLLGAMVAPVLTGGSRIFLRQITN
jgi:hypothetical protein